MATSGSVDWNQTRNEIITEALSIVGEYDPGEAIDQNDINAVDRAMNRVLKSWNNNILGFQVFTQKHGTLFLNLNKHKYSLGPSGDHATASYTTVYLQSAASPGLQVIIDAGVASVGQNIGIVNKNKDLEWTTVTSASSSGTIVLTGSLSSSATLSNRVYLYTDKVERPVDLKFVYFRDINGEDDELRYMERDEYFDLYDKDRDGEPNYYYWEQTLTDATIYFDYEPDDCNETVEFIYRRPFEDFDNTSDNPDLPQEWIRAFIWGVAAEIGPEYGVDLQRQGYLDNKASSLLRAVMSLYADTPRHSKPCGLM